MHTVRCVCYCRGACDLQGIPAADMLNNMIKVVHWGWYHDVQLSYAPPRPACYSPARDVVAAPTYAREWIEWCYYWPHYWQFRIFNVLQCGCCRGMTVWQPPPSAHAMPLCCMPCNHTYDPCPVTHRSVVYVSYRLLAHALHRREMALGT